MEQFVERHRESITAVLSGFDRIRFGGTLRSISYLEGVEVLFSRTHTLIKTSPGSPSGSPIGSRSGRGRSPTTNIDS